MGGTAIKAINLLKTVYTVRSERYNYKEEFPELFIGLGKLKHEDIKIRQVKSATDWCTQ